MRERPDPLTPGERDRVLAAFRERKPFWYPFVHFLFYTGCRPSEVAALRSRDIDLARGIVAITKSRDGGSESAPKTAKSHREIELLPNVQEILRALPGAQGPRDAYVFQNPRGNPITTTYWPRRRGFPCSSGSAFGVGSSTPRATRSSRGRSATA